MVLLNADRPSCGEMQNSALVSHAYYAGKYEFPVIKPVFTVPNRVVSFQRALKTKDYDCWVHFYLDDHQFERVWRQPRRYQKILKKFNGVILPDFSLYRDMPYVMQLWNIYRSRAIGAWLQKTGMLVIPNVRFADERTYTEACKGLSQHAVIAVGTLGALGSADDKRFFAKGLAEVVDTLKPIAIVVYGTAPDWLFQTYKSRGIDIVHFCSETSLYFGKE